MRGSWAVGTLVEIFLYATTLYGPHLLRIHGNVCTVPTELTHPPATTEEM
jgi:hypothetical protein